MVCNAQIGVPACSSTSNCPDLFGCPPGVCPDFTIKLHDTKPPFRVSIDDCDGALDLTDPNLVLEANMWANGRLKTAIQPGDTSFSLANNIGFEQCREGDIIVISRPRGPEHMLVTGFDETNYLIEVERGYNGSTPSAWKKGTFVKIFRTLNAPASIMTMYENIPQEDGTIAQNVLTNTYLVYEWNPSDTCMPGCYLLEFKLLRMFPMTTTVTGTTSSTTSTTLSTTAVSACTIGNGVDWVRRFPESNQGFLIKIVPSPTAEF